MMPRTVRPGFSTIASRTILAAVLTLKALFKADRCVMRPLRGCIGIVTCKARVWSPTLPTREADRSHGQSSAESAIVARPLGRNPDLYACLQPWTRWRPEPCRPAARSVKVMVRKASNEADATGIPGQDNAAKHEAT